MQKNLIMDEYIGSIEDSHLNASTSTDYDYCNDPFQSWTRIACISSITQFAVVDNLNHWFEIRLFKLHISKIKYKLTRQSQPLIWNWTIQITHQ